MTRSHSAGRTWKLPGRRPPAWWKSHTGIAAAGLFGAEDAIGYRHHALGEALAAASVIAPLIIALLLLTAILCGSDRTCERVFRLLRWITNRPEPAAPGTDASPN